jgi:hypothetical protein
MPKYSAIYSLVLITFLSACNKTVTIKDVEVVGMITHPNDFYEYQYLSIPDSASQEELLSITKQIRERDDRSFKETVYHYYLGNNRDNKFAILHGYHGGRPARDTLEVIQRAHDTDLELGEALKQIQGFKDKKKYVVSDSCYGIWRNWANPFTFYLILYRHGNNYVVETFNPDFGLGMHADTAFREEGLKRIALRYEKQEWVGTTPREENNTYRFILNEFGDLTWLDQYGKGEEFVQGVYSYVCACDHQQDLSELRSK